MLEPRPHAAGSGLTFFTNPMSRGRIVRWMLEEVGQPYETRILTWGPDLKSQDYLDINPMGKVPAVVHGDVVVTECAAICAYLADAFPEAGLAPAVGNPARAAYYRWMFFAAGPVEAAVTNRALQLEPPAERAAMVGYGSFDATMDALETAVTGRDYIAGDKFSAADVYVGAQIGWGLAFKTIPARPAFETYWARLEQRPAHRRATELDDALIPAQAEG